MIKKYFFKNTTWTDKTLLGISTTTVNGSFIEHTHDISELVIITNGHGIHTVNSKPYKVSAGNVFVLTSEVVHSFSECDNLAMYNIEFDMDTLDRTPSDIKEIPGFHSLFVLNPEDIKNGLFRQHFKLNNTSMIEISNHLNKMTEASDKYNLGRQTILYSYFMELVVKLASLYDFQPKDKSNKNHMTADLLSYIERNYKRKLSIEEISVSCNISVRHINRLFKDYLNTTPTNYINNLRLEFSYNLLLNTELSIVQIALESGFSESGYFIKCFKKKYNTTPQKIRHFI